MECEFCKKSFSNVWNLKTHQKTAKYCIKLQNNVDGSLDIDFSCEYCSRPLSSKRNLERHYKTCKEFIHDSKLKELENALKDLRKKVEILQSSPTISNSHNTNTNSHNTNSHNTTNTTINNNFFLDPERVAKLFQQKFDDTYLTNGLEGVARFVVKHILTTEGKLQYKCTDYARNVFLYHDENGKEQIDHEAKHLTSVIKRPTHKRVIDVRNILQKMITDTKAIEEYRSLTKDEQKMLESMTISLDESNDLIFDIPSIERNRKFSNLIAKMTHRV